MGVVSAGKVEEGEEFGPIPATLTLADPAVLIGHRTCDTPPDIHSVQVDVCERRAGSGLIDWVPYVQAARDELEQNLEAFLKDGQLFYRALKNVSAGKELYVWYSSDYANYLGLPPLQAHFYKGSVYSCPYCTETFRYANCLRAHMRFKCKYRHHVIMAQKSAIMSSCPPLRCDVKPDDVTKPAPVPVSPAPRRESPSSHSISPHSSASHSPASSSLASHDLKRPCDTEAGTGQLSPKRRTLLSQSKSDSDQGIGNRVGSCKDYTGEETRSAFQRVDRMRKEPDMGERMNGMPSSTHHPLLSPAGTILSSNPMNLGGERMRMPVNPYSIPNMPPRLPITSRSKLEMPHSRLPLSGVANENSPLHGLPTPGITPMAMMDSKLFENNNIHPKLPYPSAAALPYVYRSPNPMVEKILQIAPAPPTSLGTLNVAQNWCAKCNATFRMTSDLVYHMRSHHKREFDPVKKKRDDKLRCDVCGETFRERHHLTRHMTSHASA